MTAICAVWVLGARQDGVMTDHLVQVRYPRPDLAVLDALAEHLRTSRSEAIRFAVRVVAEQTGAAVTTAATKKKPLVTT